MALLAALLLTACGGGGGGGGSVGTTGTSSSSGASASSGAAETPTGTVRVGITDAAGPYASVVLSIREIRVVPGGGDETPVASFDPPRVVDVLQLQFQQEILGEALVPVGKYQQLRLVLAPNPNNGAPVNYVTLAADPTTLIPLDTPSGQQSGIKVLGRFEVIEGETTAVVLDFDPTKAIVVDGNGDHAIKPTGIRIVAMATALAQFGALSGSVLPQDAWPTAVVSVIPAGGTGAIASGLVNPDDGSFRAFVPAGDYTVRVTADGFATFDAVDTYTVAVGAETIVGTITLSP